MKIVFISGLFVAENIPKIRDSGLIEIVAPLVKEDDGLIQTLVIIFLSYISFDGINALIYYENR